MPVIIHSITLNLDHTPVGLVPLIVPSVTLSAALHVVVRWGAQLMMVRKETCILRVDAMIAATNVVVVAYKNSRKICNCQ